MRSGVPYIICFFCAFAFTAQAQKSDYGYTIGVFNYFGDLNTHTSFKVARPAAIGYYRYNFDRRVSWRSSLGYGYIYGNDNISPNLLQRWRNLNFFSPIKEVNTMIEFNFLEFSTLSKKYKFSPYLAAGVSLFQYNPQTILNGQTYDLQKLGTEGQYISDVNTAGPYRLTGTSFLIGGGFKWRINRNVSLIIEAVQHKTHTDYLDDVSGSYVGSNILYGNATHDELATVHLADRSWQIRGKDVFTYKKQRGSNNKNDSYLYIGIGLSYTVGKYKCPFH